MTKTIYLTKESNRKLKAIAWVGRKSESAMIRHFIDIAYKVYVESIKSDGQSHSS